MKKLFKAALVFLPFLLFVMGVNWYADPANVLRTGYERQVAEILASGQNAANLRNMDDRSFLRAYLALRTQPVDTLVLGSSRSMQVTAEVTDDPNTFCAGMTGADLRDTISAYRLLRAQGFAPKRVILNIDPWFLCEQTQEKRAMTDGYREFCRENGLRAVGGGAGVWDTLQSRAERAVQAVSLPYFQSSLAFLQKGLHTQRDPQPTQEYYTATDMRRADGTYCYSAALRDATPEQRQARAQEYITAKPKFARDFTVVSAELTRQLQVFVETMQADGAQVALLLSPFQPDYYAYMQTQTDNYVQLLSTEETVRAVAAQCGVSVIGSYNPTVCGAEAADFYDAQHCSDAAMQKLYPEDLFAAAH